MTIREQVSPKPDHPERLTACIFDVDGVLLASPHERAWREALRVLLTRSLHHRDVSGPCRGQAAPQWCPCCLGALGVPDAGRQAVAYAERKQKRLEELIEAGTVAAFPDAFRFVQAVGALGWPWRRILLKNANRMMRPIRLDSGQSLLDVFSANVCGRDLRQGKPDPEIFLLAAAELRVAPANCFVVEDAPAGIEAARAGGMTALGVAR